MSTLARDDLGQPAPCTHVDARFCRHQFEKHSGIVAISKSTPAIPLVDAGLRKHQLETQVASQNIPKLKERPRTVLHRAETRDGMGNNI